MNSRKIDSINWHELWKEELQKTRTSGMSRINWDQFAQDFDSQYARSDYRDQLLSRLEIEPDCSVLDVGCGPGNLAVLLAGRARTVTALDTSVEMLRLAEREASR